MLHNPPTNTVSGANVPMPALCHSQKLGWEPSTGRLNHAFRLIVDRGNDETELYLVSRIRTRARLLTAISLSRDEFAEIREMLNKPRTK